MHGSAGAATAVAELKNGRDRLLELVRRANINPEEEGDRILILIAKEQPTPTQAFAQALHATGDHRCAMRCQRLAQMKRDFPEAFTALFGD